MGEVKRRLMAARPAIVIRHLAPGGECKARLGSMRALWGCMLGWKHQLVGLRGRAEANPMAAINDLAALEALPSRTRRHVRCSYPGAQPELLGKSS
jgi:hypothetical protein